MGLRRGAAGRAGGLLTRPSYRDWAKGLRPIGGRCRRAAVGVGLAWLLILSAALVTGPGLSAAPGAGIRVLLPLLFRSRAVVPDTTLARETGNNTSASSAFAPPIPANLRPGNVSKVSLRTLLYPGATTRIYAHVVPWFGNPAHSRFLDVGYRSDDPDQVRRQVDDMLSRGIDGAVVDWYGDPALPPGLTVEDASTRVLMREAERRAGAFEFSVMIDAGTLRWCECADKTAKLIHDLLYVQQTYESSPAYMRLGGRPVVWFFDIDANYGIDWPRVRATVGPSPLFLQLNGGAFANPAFDGAYMWVSARDGVTDDWGRADIAWFLTQATTAYPTKTAAAGTYKGFDDSLVRWGPTGQARVINQNCGQVWLDTFSEIGRHYSAQRQLPLLQVITWNDYEESTAIESGIDNCVSVTAAAAGSLLTWSIVGDERTLDHFTVFVSADGQNLMTLADLPPSARSFDLSGLGLRGDHVVYVKAVGRPSLTNRMSPAVGVHLG